MKLFVSLLLENTAIVEPKKSDLPTNESETAPKPEPGEFYFILWKLQEG